MWNTNKCGKMLAHAPPRTIAYNKEGSWIVLARKYYKIAMSGRLGGIKNFGMLAQNWAHDVFLSHRLLLDLTQSSSYGDLHFLVWPGIRRSHRFQFRAALELSVRIDSRLKSLQTHLVHDIWYIALLKLRAIT